METTLTDKQITCAKLHLAILSYYASINEPMDEMLPCEVCKYNVGCDIVTARMKTILPIHAEWVYEMNDDNTITWFKDIEKFIENKKLRGYAQLTEELEKEVVRRVSNGIDTEDIGVYKDNALAITANFCARTRNSCNAQKWGKPLDRGYIHNY